MVHLRLVRNEYMHQAYQFRPFARTFYDHVDNLMQARAIGQDHYRLDGRWAASRVPMPRNSGLEL